MAGMVEQETPRYGWISVLVGALFIFSVIFLAFEVGRYYERMPTINSPVSPLASVTPMRTLLRASPEPTETPFPTDDSFFFSTPTGVIR